MKYSRGKSGSRYANIFNLIIKMKELYVDPTSYMVRVKDNLGNDTPLEKNRSLSEFLISYIKARYKEAWKACCEDNGIVDGYLQERKALERFCRCNFGILDGTADVANGHIELEEVHCPLRGYCKQEYIICKPKLTLTYTQESIAEDMIVGRTKYEICKKRGLTFSQIKNAAYRLRQYLGLSSNTSLLKFLRGAHQERRMEEFSFIKKNK